MDGSAVSSEFFRAGGTLHRDARSYVERPADAELFKVIISGQFCYVLTSRQMGKSSLMIRVAAQLRQTGMRTAIVDLSGLGTLVTVEQWYLGIITRIASELKLASNPEQWWHQHRALSPVQRFTHFLHDMILSTTQERIVIFIDEIDTTLKLPFTDDFFAAIRAMYNLRASDALYERLVFVLLGVAAPIDLIKDRNHTPFNIGYAIDLLEFSRDDAQPLAEGLEQIYPGEGSRILDRIFDWTNGHPYLTQKLCQEITRTTQQVQSDEQIDQLVVSLFLNEDAGKEENLQFVRSNIEASRDRRRLLQLYQRVYQGSQVREDKQSPLQNRLRLIGLIRTEHDGLQVRNRIYRQVFNAEWIRENMPTNRTRIITILTISISVITILIASIFNQLRTRQKIELLSNRYQRASDTGIQLYYLDQLCQISPAEAQTLFFTQNPNLQEAFFLKVNTFAAEERMLVVIDCLAPSLAAHQPNPKQKHDLMRAMCHALSKTDGKQDNPQRQRIKYHLACQTPP